MELTDLVLLGFSDSRSDFVDRLCVKKERKRKKKKKKKRIGRSRR